MLPYLEIQKDNESEEDIKQEIEVPNLIGKSVKEATNELKDLGLNITVKRNNDNGEDINNESIITEQLPIKGIKAKEDTAIIVYVD